MRNGSSKARNLLRAWPGGRANSPRILEAGAWHETCLMVGMKTTTGKVRLNDAARAVLKASGYRRSAVVADVRNLAAGRTSRMEVLDECLNGAAESERDGWVAYVDAVCAAAAELDAERDAFAAEHAR